VDAPDALLLYAPLQDIRLAGEEGFGVGTQDPVLFGRYCAADVGGPLVFVLALVVADGPVAVLRDTGAGLGGVMEGGELSGNRFQHGGCDFVAIEKVVHHAVGGETAHMDGVFDGFAGSVDYVAGGRPANRDDAEVRI